MHIKFTILTLTLGASCFISGTSAVKNHLSKQSHSTKKIAPKKCILVKVKKLPIKPPLTPAAKQLSTTALTKDQQHQLSEKSVLLLDNTVIKRLNLTTGKLTKGPATIPAGHAPISLATSITHLYHSSLGPKNGAQYVTTHELSKPANTHTFTLEPKIHIRSALFHPSEPYLYLVTYAYTKQTTSLWKINLTTQTTTRTKLSNLTSPHAGVLTADGRHLYLLTNGYCCWEKPTPGVVYKLDLDNRAKKAAKILIDGRCPHALALAPNQEKLYVTLVDGLGVQTINKDQAGQVIALGPKKDILQKYPEQITFNPDGSRAIVTIFGDYHKPAGIALIDAQQDCLLQIIAPAVSFFSLLKIPNTALALVQQVPNYAEEEDDLRPKDKMQLYLIDMNRGALIKSYRLGISETKEALEMALMP
ncbi:MAG: hypothetical protein RLZ12_619 [Bacillota bacterium]|jgi:hypothetical protein